MQPLKQHIDWNNPSECPCAVRMISVHCISPSNLSENQALIVAGLFFFLFFPDKPETFLRAYETSMRR